MITERLEKFRAFFLLIFGNTKSMYYFCRVIKIRIMETKTKAQKELFLKKLDCRVCDSGREAFLNFDGDFWEYVENHEKRGESAFYYCQKNSSWFVLDFLPQSKKEEITELELNFLDNSILELPESVATFPNLKWLELIGNNIQVLPDSIGNLVSLRGLMLNSNSLISLPDSIGNLKNLGLLNLNHNKLTKLPESIAELKNLQHLYLTGNNFSDSEKEKIESLLPKCKIVF